jgi:hypothetical protein
MTTKSKVAAASVACLCLAVLAPQPASAEGGGTPPHRNWSGIAKAFPSPAPAPSRKWGAFKTVNLQPQVSHRTGVLTNPGVWKALKGKGYVLVPVHGDGGGGSLIVGPKGPSSGGVPPSSGFGSGPIVAAGGGGSGPGPSLAPPVVAGPNTTVTPVTPPNPCSCLTKATLADGSVLFRDLCTNQAAAAPAVRPAAALTR